jgi:AcrR family transcriptional regulator
MVIRRARSEADKQARRGDIIDAAREVFDASEADQFTMDAVAVKLGLAKGTLYRYFPTREGLLLELAGAEYQMWFDRIDQRLVDLPATAVAHALVDEVLRVPRFMRLAALVPSVLERNVPFDTAFTYKSALVARSGATIEGLAATLGVSIDQARRLLLQLQAMAIGMYHVAHPAPIIALVIADPCFPGQLVDERAELEAAVSALVAGTGRDASR